MKLKNIKSFSKILSRQFCHGNKVPRLDPSDLPPSRSQLVPEISLRLLTPSHELWHKPVFQEDEHLEPFWSIFWPGGQVLTRFIFDSKILEGKRVLDLGCGCGAQGMFTTWVNINIFLSQKSRCLEVLSFNNFQTYFETIKSIGDNVTIFEANQSRSFYYRDSTTNINVVWQL